MDSWFWHFQAVVHWPRCFKVHSEVDIVVAMGGDLPLSEWDAKNRKRKGAPSDPQPLPGTPLKAGTPPAMPC